MPDSTSLEGAAAEPLSATGVGSVMDGDSRKDAREGSRRDGSRLERRSGGVAAPSGGGQGSRVHGPGFKPSQTSGQDRRLGQGYLAALARARSSLRLGGPASSACRTATRAIFRAAMRLGSMSFPPSSPET